MKNWVKKTHYVERFDDVRVQLCAFVVVLSPSPTLSQGRRMIAGSQQYTECTPWLANTSSEKLSKLTSVLIMYNNANTTMNSLKSMT